MLPVPKASLVTLTLDRPSVTQSVADLRAAPSAIEPLPARAPATRLVFKKSRLE
jgi:hypothetical protein